MVYIQWNTPLRNMNRQFALLWMEIGESHDELEKRLKTWFYSFAEHKETKQGIRFFQIETTPRFNQ